MLNSPLGGRRGIGFGLGRSWQRKSGDWWLAGGIPAANCVAAYQAKGATSYAASKVNLANPGMYDAIEGTAPDWDAVSGWKFVASSSHWLYIDYIVPNDQSHSIIVRFSNYITPNKALSLARGTGTTCDFGLYIPNDTTHTYFSGDKVIHSLVSSRTSGVVGLAGNYGYWNGTKYDVAINMGTGTQTVKQPIGCMDALGSRSLYFWGYIQAFALYSAVLTAAQVSAVTTAIQAL